MIGFIIGVIIFVLIVCSIAFAGFYIVKKEQKQKGIILGAAASVLILLFILIPFSFHTVNAGEVAVVKHLGKAEKVRTAGTYFDFWITESYDVYDAKVQNLEIKTQAYSKDAQTMDVAMTVQYQISY